MTTYITLLRGINVSGKNNIKMNELKTVFTDLGYQDVVTYKQSGNIIFNSNIKESIIIEDTIVSAILKHFGYTIKVILLTKKELLAVFNSNPFLARNPSLDISKLHVTLLHKSFNLGVIEEHLQIDIKAIDDEFEQFENTIYLYCPNGYGKTKLNNNMFEKKLNTDATTRNWNTISKLVELSN